METITNVVNTVSTTATKAIWGEHNETAGNEPISGVQGKGTATEPYDQGNAEDPADPTIRNETAGKEPVSGLEGKGTATDPFDQGNSADATNTTSLPIREKATDLTAKPTIPAGDAFNSATAANASTLGHTSAVTSDIENNSAGVAGTKNLSDTLSKTELDMGAEHDKVPASKNEPGLAGFGGDRKIDPEDKSQLPTEVSNATTSGTLTSSTDEKSAGAAGTANLSETLAKTNPPTLSPTTTPKSPLTMGEEASGKSDASKAGAAKEADRLVEEKNAHKNAAATNKETSPSGEKEKVSKMEKLKEKLHLKKHKSEE